MYDIDRLEKQWRRYRLKKLILPVGSVVLLSGAGLYFRSVSAHDPSDVSNTVLSAKPSHKPEQSTGPAGDASSRASSSEKKSGWKMTFSDSRESGKSPEKSKRTTKHIIINVTPKNSAHLTAEEIKQRFASDPDKDDALFLARYYYDKKDYKQSLKWSLETNKMDSNIVESWLLFAKAKAKLGDRAEAIRILQTFYDRTGSVKAGNLLKKIRRGQAF